MDNIIIIIITVTHNIDLDIIPMVVLNFWTLHFQSSFTLIGHLQPFCFNVGN